MQLSPVKMNIFILLKLSKYIKSIFYPELFIATKAPSLKVMIKNKDKKARYKF